MAVVTARRSLSVTSPSEVRRRIVDYVATGLIYGAALLGCSTLLMLAVAALIAVPVGMATAIYLSEFGRGRLASVIRLVIDLLAGLPSIVVGVFVWAIVVRHVL